MPDPIVDNMDKGAHQEQINNMTPSKEDVIARKKIIIEWMKDVRLDQQQIPEYQVLRNRLVLLACNVDLSKDEYPTVWDMIEQSIPEKERKTFEQDAIRALQQPLSGLPREIFHKTKIVQDGNPISQSFDELHTRIGKNVLLNKRQFLLII